MVLNAATLNGLRATEAKVMLPDWGCWFAEAHLDSEAELAGEVDLHIADLALKGAILSGGPAKGRSDYWIVGGRGKWGNTIDRRSYASDAGVKITKILGDAARDCGETFESSSSDSAGPAWTRVEGPASTQLELLARRGWYVGEDGITRLGARPSSTLPPGVTRISPVDRSRLKVVLASDSIAAILPGVVVDGLTAVDVEHAITAKGLRTTVWGKRRAGGHSRGLEAFTALLEHHMPGWKFRGLTEYRIVTREGPLLNLQPVLRSVGMPDLPRVRVMPGVPGCSITPKLGSRVAVAFLNGDPALPRVVSFESDVASSGLELVTDGIGAGGHGVTAEQVLVMFANFVCVMVQQSAFDVGFNGPFTATPTAGPTKLATILGAMIPGSTAPTVCGLSGAPGGVIGGIPGAAFPTPGAFAGAVTGALASQLPDPASAGLPTPELPGLAKKGLKL